LPGIAVRCVRAYQRLLRRGGFVQPASAGELVAEIKRGSNPKPMMQMFEECFEVDWNSEVLCGAAWAAFKDWCETHGRADLLAKTSTPSMFGKWLKTVPGFAELGPKRIDSNPRFYRGLRLRRETPL
jgi:putative DNA primase/helicase